jgi:hypothetical protein
VLTVVQRTKSKPENPYAVVNAAIGSCIRKGREEWFNLKPDNSKCSERGGQVIRETEEKENVVACKFDGPYQTWFTSSLHMK